MSLGNAGKELAEHRVKPARKGLHQPATLAYLHYAEPERQHARQSERDFKSRLGRFERGVHYGGKHRGVAKENELHRGHDKRYAEESYPYIIENHGMFVFMRP